MRYMNFHSMPPLQAALLRRAVAVGRCAVMLAPAPQSWASAPPLLHAQLCTAVRASFAVMFLVLTDQMRMCRTGEGRRAARAPAGAELPAPCTDSSPATTPLGA